MSVVDEIKERLDIVEVIGGYVPLQKAGRNFKGLCPFHTEKTPSFIVFPDSQNWHCFGACSTGGDIFTFIMRRENLDFPEALQLLAERAGVELRPLDQEELREKDELDRLRRLNVAAAQYYHHILLESAEGAAARAYLERRGVLRETIATFQLGYAPNAWHALEERMQAASFTPQDLLAAGLSIKADSGNVYDRFRARLMFPIRDAQGHVIGFAGRVLDDALPKYMNTPQTPLFDKGSILYGIDLARDAIRESGTAIVVEGYMDVIVPYQCGVRNLVAVMGTALTEAHLQVLKRSTKVLILAMDADAAGMHATEKGVQVAQEMLNHKVVPVPTATGLVRYEEQLDAEIRVLVLPEGRDPDELILEDRTRWDQLVAGALPVADYFFDVVLRQADLASARGKREAVDRLLPVVAAMDNPVSRSHYLQRLAQRVHVEERVLGPELDRLRGENRGAARRGMREHGPTSGQRAAPQRAADVFARNELSLAERCLALFLLSPHSLHEMVARVGLLAEAFEDVRDRQVFESLLALEPVRLSSGAEWPELLPRLDTELRARVESLLSKLQLGPPLTPELIREDLVKCSTRLQRNYLARLLRELHFLQQDAQDEGAEERVRELNALIERRTREYLSVDQLAYAATLVGRKQFKGDGS